MDIDLLEHNEEKTFSEIFSNASKYYDNLIFNGNELNSACMRRYMKEAFMKGFLKGIDEYKKLMGK